ncbi:dihydroxyacetone kinase subunit L [Clostridium sp. D2Q-14]|uniref:dihydroxyacetone kinase subunit DhaL n=1 Tax=Anaeromonas gelatinilytica TaxID=2683194 RepID=UPI00193B0D00|nr:dihydroxyacetone kinase subunit DhaL [Anaeromonas gelatinilytica]MBS4534518.1 dihydroxyacetone kinase subunit L [Anaeromonas gelatinilytica]
MTTEIMTIFDKVSDEVITNKEYLTDLDSSIGDGDHGINMARGFSKVKEKIAETTFEGNSQFLKTIAMTLISTVGGASGPLYGTAFLNASKVVSDDNISYDNLIQVGESIIEGIKKRGKAELGEKTMLDTIIPAVNSLKESKSKGINLKPALKNCLKAAEEGMKATIPIIATKGRASYLGERSKGHQDPGATSSYIVIKTIIDEIL